MLTHPTIDQLRALKLDGMAEAFVELQSQDQAARSRTCRMAGAAARSRGGASRHSAVQKPAAQCQAAPRPSVDRGRRLPHAATARQGAVPATGRRPLDRRASQSARHRAVRRRQVVAQPARWRRKPAVTATRCIYARVPRLFADLELAHGDGRFARLFRTLIKADLLILDDWGPDRLSANQRRDLMEIVEDRYGAGSTLITSQLPGDAWHEVIGEPTFADAILDRIVHNAYRLALDGPSMRKLQANAHAEPEPEPQPANKAAGSVTSHVTKPAKGEQK